MADSDEPDRESIRNEALRRIGAEQFDKQIRAANTRRGGIVAQLADQEAERRLRQEQVDKGIAWLQQKWQNGGACPYCQTHNWAVGTPLNVLVATDPDSVTPDSAMSPLFPVMCMNCGNTVLINAIVARLVEGES